MGNRLTMIGTIAVVATIAALTRVPIAEPPVIQQSTSDGAGVVLKRAPNGHFYTNAMVNGRLVRFVIDTGATTVALSRRDAATAGVEVSDADFTETGRAASGDVKFAPVQLSSVDIGNLEVANVEAVVLDGDVDQSLLGQSWLSRIPTVSIQNDEMTLRQ